MPSLIEFETGDAAGPPGPDPRQGQRKLHGGSGFLGGLRSFFAQLSCLVLWRASLFDVFVTRTSTVVAQHVVHKVEFYSKRLPDPPRTRLLGGLGTFSSRILLLGNVG